MKFTAIGIFIILSTIFVLEVNSCSCLPEHAQNTFCRNDDAFKFVVKSVKYFGIHNEEIEKPTDPFDINYNNGMKQYVIKVVKVYKGSLTVGSELKARSPMNDGICGVTLIPGSAYITIASRPIVNRSILIETCDYLVMQKHLVPSFRHIIRQNFLYRFARTCGRCEISYDNIEATRGCYAKQTSSIAYLSKQACLPIKGGRCQLFY